MSSRLARRDETEDALVMNLIFDDSEKLTIGSGELCRTNIASF